MRSDTAKSMPDRSLLAGIYNFASFVTPIFQRAGANLMFGQNRLLDKRLFVHPATATCLLS